MLELLAQRLGCYISSLPAAQWAALRYLREFPPRQFSMEEWSYCLGYIFRERVRLEGYAELEDYLVQKAAELRK